MTYQVKTFNNINKIGLAELGPDFEVDQTDEADAFILRSQKLHDYVFPRNLMAIARAGAGVNNIPIERCTDESIIVFNTPGANANAVKEAVLASMLLSARDYIAANSWQNSLSGDNVSEQVEAGKKQFAGTEIAGKNLGIIGLGAIGARIANDAQRLGMHVYGYDPYLSIDMAWSISHHVRRVNSLDEIFANADYITIHVPLTDETRGVFAAENFEKMRDGAVLINFSRGELVDNADLLEALSTGKLKHYITDFGSEELLNHPQIKVFPHIGGSTEEAELNCAIMAAQTIRRFFETGEIVNAVNFPNVRQPLTAPFRLTLINKNVPDVVARVSAAVAEEGINIVNIVNRSRGKYAYTLLDLDASDEKLIMPLVARFEEREDILKVRVIKK